MVLTVGAFIAGALVATIAVKQMPTAVKQMPTAKSLTLDDSLIELQEAKKNKTQKKKLLPKPEECSLAKTQNCMKSQCCENFGFQCYQKNATYAACLKKM